MKRTTILLHDDDLKAIERVQRKFGVSSDSDGLRLSVRMLASMNIEETITFLRAFSDENIELDRNNRERKIEAVYITEDILPK